MPHRLPKLILDIAASDSPREVLNALNEAGPLQMLSAWRAHPDGRADTLVCPDTTSVRLKQEHEAAVKEFGTSPMWHLTLIHAPDHQPIGRDQWLFNLLQDHGIRDGFIVHHENWVMTYWSKHILNEIKLRQEVRLTLSLTIAAAAHRLNELMPKKKVRSVELSPRELAVLEHLSRGKRITAIAAHLELTERTVREYLKRAQRKLNAETTTEAAVIAVRRRLI